MSALLCFVAGAYLFGWLFPEFLHAMSPNGGNLKIPALINFISAVAFALLAYGVKA
jgi:hypothetical protein